MAAPTFGSLEKEGWDRNAARYDEILLHGTSQAFGPIHIATAVKP